MGDPVTPSLGFAASAARFIAQLNAVKDETGIIVGQVKVVANDIAEAERLYLKNRLYLSDGDRSRVEQAIKSTRLAVDRIAREVEPARKSVKKVGTVNVLERVDWILRRSGTTETYQHSLETCHRSLLDKISMLRGVRLITGDQWASSPESTSTVGDCGRDGAQDESNENDDNASLDSSGRDDTSSTEEANDIASPESDTCPVVIATHPERALYEITQINHIKKLNKPRPVIHPERLRYEEMQKRYHLKSP